MKNQPPLINRMISLGLFLGSFLLGSALIAFFQTIPAAIAGLVLFAVGVTASLIIEFTFVRCPHCGSHLVGREAKATCCPYCGKKM
ncbi:MAG: hypothetical protein IKW87_08600 [Ruminococcus sp.]|nr:hypothetical protein [Ruminococcus sp.]